MKIKSSSLAHRICFWEVVSSNVIKGSDKNISEKVKFHETQKEKLTGDHAEPIKTEKLTQPSKKVGCPVTFAIKKIYSFPEYKISADTKRQITNASTKLRDNLAKKFIIL